MSRWFRFYDDTINDPKSLKLSDKTYRIWVGMLCLASKNNGVLPSFEDMAILLRIRPDKLQPELEKLIMVKLLDHSDIGIVPHNWNKRQYKSDVSTDRVKRFRNAERNVSETAPDTEADTEPETEAESPSQLASPIQSNNLSFGEAKREEPPKHCAQTAKGGGRIYVHKGTSEWEAYAADYRAARGEEPNANAHGGRWFKSIGEAS